ncbi:hypothetical protein V6Z12_D06G130200 [Gossypium hirsutum]
MEPRILHVINRSCDNIFFDAFSWLAVYGYIVEEISIEKWSINHTNLLS